VRGRQISVSKIGGFVPARILNVLIKGQFLRTHLTARKRNVGCKIFCRNGTFYCGQRNVFISWQVTAFAA